MTAALTYLSHFENFITSHRTPTLFRPEADRDFPSYFAFFRRSPKARGMNLRRVATPLHETFSRENLLRVASVAFV